VKVKRNGSLSLLTLKGQQQMKNYKTLALTVRAGSIRSLHGVVSSEDVQVILTLLDGSKVDARVYSSTNMCFSVTEKAIKKAWDNLDKSKHYWINEKKVDGIVKRFTLLDSYRNTLAVPLPNLHCESTPSEIEEMLKVS